MRMVGVTCLSRVPLSQCFFHDPQGVYQILHLTYWSREGVVLSVVGHFRGARLLTDSLS